MERRGAGRLGRRHGLFFAQLAIEKALKTHGVDARLAILFGSWAHGAATSSSDIDLTPRSDNTSIAEGFRMIRAMLAGAASAPSLEIVAIAIQEISLSVCGYSTMVA